MLQRITFFLCKPILYQMIIIWQQRYKGLPLSFGLNHIFVAGNNLLKCYIRMPLSKRIVNVKSSLKLYVFIQCHATRRPWAIIFSLLCLKDLPHSLSDGTYVYKMLMIPTKLSLGNIIK